MVLAYGKMQQIEKSLTNLLGNIGDSPFKFVLNFGKDKRRQLQGFKHRFTTGHINIFNLRRREKTGFPIFPCVLRRLKDRQA